MTGNGVKRRGLYFGHENSTALPFTLTANGSSSPRNKRPRGGGKKTFIAVAGIVSFIMVTILSVQVVWLKKSNSRYDKKKGSMDSNVKSSRKVVQTPAFDSSKLDQIRQQKRREQVSMREKSRADNNMPPSDGIIPKAPSLAEFPQWIQDYVQWHVQQRQHYPVMELFQNPNAPKLLIRTCLGICGGLHDRIGQLPWDLYLAAKTKRLLLVAWQRPKELENFLLPNELSKGEDGDANTIMLDWRVPIDAHFGFNDIKIVRNHTQLFDGYPEDHPDDDFWKTQVDLALDRAISGEFSNIRILRHRLLGHLNEGVLEQRLRDEGWYENDMKHQPEQLHLTPTFGKIFHLFFRPSPAVYDEIKTVLHMLQLTPNQYTAVHCRVRHPKAHEAGSVVKGKNAKYPADKTGLPWDEGHPLREFACQTATTALQCARDIAKEDTTSSIQTISSLPIYFLADSNDLVRHVSLELQDTKGYLKANKTGIYQPLLNEVQATPHRRIVARDVTLENAHIDRQKGRDPPAYFGTFVDLYLAMQARCVVYGIGYYAAFAAKISGTTCSYLYAQEAWGSQVSKQAHICPNAVPEN